SRVRCTFQRMRTVWVRAAGERRNGKTGADSSKAGAAPATVIEITRITSATAPEPTVREGDPPESLLQLESPETGLTRLPMGIAAGDAGPAVRLAYRALPASEATTSRARVCALQELRPMTTGLTARRALSYAAVLVCVGLATPALSDDQELSQV